MTAGTFPAMVRSFAVTHYRRMRLLYWICIPGLLAVGVAIWIFVGPIHLDMVHDPWQKSSQAFWASMRAGWYEVAFAYGWGIFAAVFFYSTVIPSLGNAASPIKLFTYPKSAMALPAKTSWLVLAPLLWGTLVPVLVWLAFDRIDCNGPRWLRYIFLLPNTCPTYLPAVGFVAAAACANAGRWISVRRPWLGILTFAFSALIVVGFTMLPGAQIEIKNFNYGLLVPLLIAIAALATGAALVVAPIARYTPAGISPFSPTPKKSGSFGGISKKPAPLTSTAEIFQEFDIPAKHAEPPALRNPTEAHVWFVEKPLQGRLLLGVITGLFVVLLLICYIASPSFDTLLGIAGIHINGGSVFVLILIGPSAIVVTRASHIITATANRRFLAVLPVTSLTFVNAEARASRRSFWRACAVLAIGAGLWLLFPARDATHTGTIGGLLFEHATGHGILAGLLLAATMLLALWGVGLESPLSYPWRHWVGKVVKFLLLLAALELLMLWFVGPVSTTTIRASVFHEPHPEGALSIVLRQLIGLTPLFICWAAVRIIFLSIGLHRVLDLRLIPEKTILLSLAAWLGGTLILGAIYSLLLPDLIPKPLYFLYAATILPLNRLIWPVLNIDASRHA